jgi:hypothetical protein
MIWQTLKDVGIPTHIEEFSEAFAGPPISALIDFNSEFDQKLLH